MRDRRTRLLAGLLGPAVVAAALVLAACGALSSSATKPSGASPSPAVSASWTGPPISAADAKAVRQRAMAYWAAFNAYKPEKVIAFLDESYKAVEAEVVRTDVGRIKTFHVQLGVSEKTAPVLIGRDRAEIYLDMKTPTGTRTVLMQFVRRGDRWMVTFSEEVN